LIGYHVPVKQKIDCVLPNNPTSTWPEQFKKDSITNIGLPEKLYFYVMEVDFINNIKLPDILTLTYNE